MSKIIKTKIHGEEITLNIGVTRFYNLFKEVTGYDILSMSGNIEASKLADFTFGVVYSGYYANCKIEKTNPRFSKEEILEAILDMEIEDVNNLIQEYTRVVGGNKENQEPGEPESQPG
jgi:hypothetical protein